MEGVVQRFILFCFVLYFFREEAFLCIFYMTLIDDTPSFCTILGLGPSPNGLFTTEQANGTRGLKKNNKKLKSWYNLKMDSSLFAYMGQALPRLGGWETVWSPRAKPVF